MKSLILISVLLFAFINVNAQYSREEAIEIVAYDIVGVYELETHHLYSKLDKMYLNDTLMLEILEFYLSPMDEAWLFFVDDMPIAYWSHPARIIWFEVNTGEIQILDVEWPPLGYWSFEPIFDDNWERIYHLVEFTKEEAIQIIIDEVITPDSLEYKNLYVRNEHIFGGDTLWMYGQNFFYFCPWGEHWLFFIDDAPPAYWSHPSRLVYFNVYSGNYFISQQEWPPFPFFENHTLFLEEWDWITSVDVEESSSQEFELALYPNPCKNEISIQYNVEPDFKPDIFISDITGNTIKAFSWENQDRQIKINTSHLNNGLYFINVFDNGKMLSQEKFLKIE